MINRGTGLRSLVASCLTYACCRFSQTPELYLNINPKDNETKRIIGVWTDHSFPPKSSEKIRKLGVCPTMKEILYQQVCLRVAVFRDF